MEAGRRAMLGSGALAAALALGGAATAAAPSLAGRAAGAGPPPIMDDELAFSLIASLLTLSEGQQRRFRAQLADGTRAARPVAGRLDATRNALFDDVRAGAGEAQLAQAAQEQGELHGRLLSLQAQTFAGLWSLLAPDQKAEVEPAIFGYIGELLATAGRTAA